MTFIMAQADAYGYLLSCSVVCVKAVGLQFHWTTALTDFAYITAISVPITVMVVMRYFLRCTNTAAVA